MDDNNENQYLAEDVDILDELKSHHIPNVPKVGGLAQLTELQIKATLRNRKSIHDMDATTTKFSIVLAAFAFAQVILGIYGFLFTAGTSAHPYLGFFYALCIGILIYIIYREVSKNTGEGK